MEIWNCRSAKKLPNSLPRESRRRDGVSVSRRIGVTVCRRDGAWQNSELAYARDDPKGLENIAQALAWDV
jgi:hypothetical protein